jgi:alanine racemase
MPLYIDASIIKENFKKLTAIYKNPPAIVLKSNAYGLGIKNILPILKDTACNTIFVGTIEEALIVRNINNQIKIIVMDFIEVKNKDFFLSNRITPTLNSLEEIDAYKEVFSFLPFVLNIDIGMNRTGVDWRMAIENIHLLLSLPVVHIMAQLSITGEEEMHPMNVIQMKRFQQVISYFPAGLEKSLAYSNVMNFGENFNYSFARIGKALYGITHKKVNLKQALKFQFPLKSVKFVKKGEIVGYKAYEIIEDMHIGVLNVGYAHGFSMAYVNTLYGVYKNIKCKVISISMEYTILEFLTIIPEVGDNICFFIDFVDENKDTYYLEQLLRFHNLQKEII